MAPLAPFEPRPRLAVAVSGGSDSLALVLLLDGWVRARRGAIAALTVDHGLRAGSAAEARQVGRWLAARGIEHHVLRWRPGRLRSRLQATAREARYRLLAEWCRRQGVVHLALGHQREDQAETLALRLARGSGLDGLAAMSRVVETDSVRLLRPLLPCPRERLRAFLRRHGQEWIEDPSNRNPAFARVRMRDALAANKGGDVELAAAARRLGGARAALESATAALLARAAAVHPAGFCTVDVEALFGAPREVTFRALARILMCIGGERYPPRREQIERLVSALANSGPATRRTLAGCIVAGRAGSLHVVREPRAVVEVVDIRPGEKVRWDGRFHVALAGRPRPSRRVRIAALGAHGRDAARGAVPPLADGVPPEVGLTLPALWDGRTLRAVPRLGHQPRGDDAAGSLYLSVSFRPAQPLAGAVFSVV